MPSSRLVNEAVQQQLRQACADLERRLHAGETCGAEDWLAAHPALAAHAASALELIYAEFVLRERLGQRPSATEWYARFPQWQEDLQQLFEIHQLAQVSSDPESADARTVLEVPSPGNRPPVSSGQVTWPGTRYRPVRFHARGGQGEVHVAHDQELGRDVVLKRLRPQWAGDPESVRRFLRDAEITGRLEYPAAARKHLFCYRRTRGGLRGVSDRRR